MKLLEKYADELKVLGDVKYSKANMWPPLPYINSPITARENYLRFARREKPMFMALDIDEVMFSPLIIPDSKARGFVVDNDGIEKGEEGGKDMFGIDWVFVPEVGGSMVRPGAPTLTDIEDWEKVINFPDISTWDWESSSKKNADLFSDRYANNVWIMSGLFERLISFMDFEGAAMAFADEDSHDAVHGLFNRLTELYEDMIPRLKKAYNVDILYFHDDWGSQRAPFFSLEMCRKLLVPYLKRVIDCAHNNGMLFNFHSCGQIEALIPAMIEAGVDIWCGQRMNDHEKLYNLYGEKIALGIPFDAPSPDATEEEVVKICQEFLDKYTVKGYAFPVIMAFDMHPDFTKILYALSRERFAE